MGLLTLKQGKLAYQLDFALYGTGIAAMGTILLIASPPAEALANSGCVLAALVGWTAIEYAIHRFVLHGLEPFRRWHAAHHRHPCDLICSPTIFSASLIFALVFLPALELAGSWHACALTFGILVGYFCYSVTHHATHHWRTKRAGTWLRRRKQWHAVHHHGQGHERCFGVTNEFWDRLLRSAPEPARPSSSERSARSHTDLSCECPQAVPSPAPRPETTA